jgi:hypothetical protein
METISVYLDNMFAGLPRNSELERLKRELLSGMEEKYLELKREGKSENEAIGIVISEFGNIEELTAELGIGPAGTEQAVPVLSEEEAYLYMAAKRSSGLWTGLGILLAACGVALFLVLDTIFENHSLFPDNESGTMLGLIGMFTLFAAAVGMFIHSGMKLGRFKNLEQVFRLPYALKTTLQRGQFHYARTFRLALITGVCLCVLSPIFIFATIYVNDDLVPYGVSAFLVSAAAAVFLFIYYGNIQGAYTKLLKEPDLTPEKKEEERIAAAVNAVVWPLATALFLFTGFVYHRWDINWVIFPIAGVLTGMSNVFHIVKRKNVS